jgi:hypothetical protein
VGRVVEQQQVGLAVAIEVADALVGPSGIDGSGEAAGRKGGAVISQT